MPLIEVKNYSFSEDVVTLIVLFCMDDALKLLRLSAGWHYQIKLALENYSTKFESALLSAYSGILSYRHSYSSTTPIDFCGRIGMRLDRIIQLEILPSK